MLVDEVNSTMIRQPDKEETQNSIEIKYDSNFHWGVKPAEKKEEGKDLEEES
jgi:ABC-type glutathione transport system ATPase component